MNHDGHEAAEGLIDLDRYPIADLDSPAAREVIAQGRAQLARDGLCLFPGFVAPQALAAMVLEAHELEPLVHRAESWVDGVDEGATKVLHEKSRNACGSVPYDRLPEESAIVRFYRLDQLLGLFKALLGLESFHRCADPVSSCMPMYYAEGEELGWHFDPNDGVVTMLLQKPEQGGAFEFVPGCGRDPRVFRRYFAGEREGVVVPPIEPGTLSLFRGAHSLHRVTRVEGRVPRIMLTMSFHTEPGMVFSAANRYRYSGREVEIRG